nr:hypothetical protein [Cronobacter turicensis]
MAVKSKKRMRMACPLFLWVCDGGCALLTRPTGMVMMKGRVDKRSASTFYMAGACAYPPYGDGGEKR